MGGAGGNGDNGAPLPSLAAQLLSLLLAEKSGLGIDAPSGDLEALERFASTLAREDGKDGAGPPEGQG